MKPSDWFGVINGSLLVVSHNHVLHNIFKTQFDGCGFLDIAILFKVTVDSKTNTNTDFLM